VTSVPGEPPAPAGARSSPYQGLVPYSEADADWFFGRDDWREIIVDNLRAYRLSVLYGASGVGKSSVLNAGVVPHLRAETRRSVLERRPPEFVVTFASWAEPDPRASLRRAIRDPIEQVVPELADQDPAACC
jgi:Novel STAND NTPase 1